MRYGTFVSMHDALSKLVTLVFQPNSTCFAGLSGWLAGWLARWLAGLLAGWLAGWLASRLAGSRVFDLF